MDAARLFFSFVRGGSAGTFVQYRSSGCHGKSNVNMESNISVVSAGVPEETGLQLLPAKFFQRLLWSLPLMAVTGFSLFGFFDTFEPMPRIAQLSWRAAYICAGLGSVVTLCWLWLKPGRRTSAAMSLQNQNSNRLNPRR
jgi:hypothetical protein